MKRIAVRCFAILIVFCSAALAQSAQRAKIAPDLKTGDPQATVNVIVQFKSPLTEAQHQKVLDRGATLKTVLPLVNGGAYSMPAGKVQDLANDPEVAYISPDRKVGARAAADIVAGTINAPLIWGAGKTGSGFGVAVIDSGIMANFPDLGNADGQAGPIPGGTGSYSRVVWAENFLVPAVNSSGQVNNAHYQTQDQYGHGTHVAGIIAGNGFISQQLGSIQSLSGIAPTANLIDFQVLDPQRMRCARKEK